MDWDRGTEDQGSAIESPGLPLLLVVEGASDVCFLKTIGTLLHRHDPQLLDLTRLEAQRRLLFLPVAGSNLKDMVPRILGLHKRMFVLLDREVEPETSERLKVVARLNRQPGCVARLTNRRALENYLHPAAIADASGIELNFDDHDDVTGLLARQLAARSGRQGWAALSCRTQKRLRQEAKKLLTVEAVRHMTVELLDELDPQGEVVGWLKIIEGLLDGV